MTMETQFYCNQDDGEYNNNPCPEQCNFCKSAGSLNTESKAVCPHCERKIPFDEIEDKWMNQNIHYMRMKCKCKKLIGIVMDMRGNFLAFDLKSKI